ncbi:hypothetical protein P43SY_001740 [Pythium insidiosum]|uniref:Protein arginine N-methyltransferase n=1 Tax=Pythium insidiosum TaxID=114742 RepID=A0AAD5LX23_PYTIN|nr:hypothetical protein P43SY_001740 [Pythium insidiosum]
MYAGVDKYGGALAGEGQPRDAGAAASGLSLEEAIETAAAEETVVVDVPYSYLEDDEDPTSLVTGTSQVLLTAQLNPSSGGLMWIQQDDTHDTYKNVVAMSQMTSMLRDHDRNRCYELGIQHAIATFQATHGRAPIVLDIGTGTGLLAMFAARHGAAHVYACEMFKPMAEIATRVTADNFADKITVFAKRSTELVVSAEHGHLPQRADMLVSELFDSILLGEAVIPTLRHAREHLLAPHAVIVPERATVFAHVVESERVYRLNSVADQQLNDKGARLARNDAAWGCTGAKPALPLHIQAFDGDATALTEPTAVLSFDFTALPSGVAPLAPRTQRTEVTAVASGRPHAVFMWWEVSFDSANRVTYSTKPGAQNWQDHWVQVVFPLTPSPSTRVQAGESLSLLAHHDDLRVWFDVEKPAAAPAATPEKPPCVCGLHLLCNAERMAMLSDSSRTSALSAAVARAVETLAARRQSAPSELACLDASDGSLGALLAASHGVGHVTSIESKDVSARIFEQICDANAGAVRVLCCGCKGLLPEHLAGERAADLLVAEPFFYSMQNLPLWQALNFWLRRTALASVLAPDAVVVPARARVLAQPVVFEHLHECFGAVGDVAGFDHAFFDQFQTSYFARNFPFPVFMYPYEPAGAVVELAAWRFADAAHSVHETAAVATQQAPNAVIIWVEYELLEDERESESERLRITTGPAVTHSKQLVRFLPPAPTANASLAASFAFNALEGDMELSVAWQ